MQSALDGSLAEEDRARADCYALVSRLFYEPPDAAFLDRLAGGLSTPVDDHRGSQRPGPEPDGGTASYATAFRALQVASRDADAHALRQEFDDLFGGAGKALVSPYTSGYAVAHAPDRHLVALRERLAAWGLARRDSVFELEDHVSAVCDVMRWLIAHGRPLEDQLVFFNGFVDVGVGVFCSAIETRAASAFYRTAATLARAFIAIEKEAFDLETPE